MTDNAQIKPPIWFWIAGVVGLIWNGMGVKAYLDQVYMSAENLAALPVEQQALLEATPGWVTGAFAIAVFAGLLGCLLLLLRKKWALIFLGASLGGILIQQFYLFAKSNSIELYGAQALILPILITIIAVFLIVIARNARGKGWIS